MLHTLRTKVVAVATLVLATGLMGTTPAVALDVVGVRPPTTCADLDIAPGEVRCFSTVDPEASALPADVTTTTPPPGLSPQDVASIYHLPAITRGLTPGPASPAVAIVDAGGTPTLEADLAAYRAQYGMGPCTVASGCLTILDQDGNTASPPPFIAGWDFETALDAEAVAASCPACRLVVVEADSPSSDDLDAATEIAAQHASYVSMSWGSDDEELSGFSDVASTEQVFSRHPDVTFVASSGDLGWATRTTLGAYVCGRNATYAAGPSSSCAQYPSTSPQVISAGGTVASWSTSTQTWTQSTWYPRSGDLNGGGASSGCSDVAPMPTPQSLNANASAACGAFRATADLSAIADDFAVYHQDLTQALTSDPAQNWWVMGGTSLSAPLIAGMYAQAGNHTAPFDIYRRAAADSAAFADVTSGATRGCDATRDALHLCSAGPGWDGPTGLGTPRGLASLMPYAAKRTSSPVTTTLSPVSHRGLVRIRGKARVRRTLRASYGTFAPGSRVTVTWLVNGHPVAAGARLRVKRSWRHHRIRYIVNATAAGHAPVTFTSSAVRIRR